MQRVFTYYCQHKLSSRFESTLGTEVDTYLHGVSLLEDARLLDDRHVDAEHQRGISVYLQIIFISFDSDLRSRCPALTAEPSNLT